MIMQLPVTRSIPGVLVALLVVLCGCIQPAAVQPADLTTVPATSPPGSQVQVTAGTAAAAGTTAAMQDEGTLPFIPGGIYREGDRIRLSAVTILSPGNRIMVEVVPVSFGPAKKTGPVTVSGTSGLATVVRGEEDSRNPWSFSFDTRGWDTDDYIVSVQGVDVPGYRSSYRFTLLHRDSGG